jgi:flagellar hook-length control protein FliK
MLNASAGPDTQTNVTPNRAGKADGADPTKAGDQSKTADDAAQSPSANADGVSSGSAEIASDAAAASAQAPTIDIAILAQAIPADPASAPSTGKPKDAGSGAANGEAAKPDEKSDGSDDAVAAVGSADVSAVTVSATSIVAVAVIAAPAATAAVQPSTKNAGDIPSIEAQTPAANTPGAPPAGPAQDSAAAQSEPVIAAAVLATAATQEPSQTTSTPDETVKPGLAGVGTVDPTAQKAPPVGSTPSDQPGKSGDPKTADVAPTQAKSSPPPEPEVASPEVQTDAKAVQGGKTKDTARDAKAIQSKTVADAPQATGRTAGEQDSNRAHADEQDPKASAAHQAHEQGSDHSAVTPRVALSVAHSDVPAPATLAQALTPQPGAQPSPLGIAIAAPLASPLQAVWQSAPDRPDTSDKAVPVAGVAVEIVSRAQDGLRRFDIRLDPPELGRIDVRLDVDNGGNVTSRLTVDRPETLDLLRRDAPQLERALQHAGLNTEGGLQFSLRDQNFANRQQTPQNAPTFIIPDDEPAAAEAARRGYGRLIGLGGGIDIRV